MINKETIRRLFIESARIASFSLSKKPACVYAMAATICYCRLKEKYWQTPAEALTEAWQIYYTIKWKCKQV